MTLPILSWNWKIFSAKRKTIILKWHTFVQFPEDSGFLDSPNSFSYGLQFYNHRKPHPTKTTQWQTLYYAGYCGVLTLYSFDSATTAPLELFGDQSISIALRIPVWHHLQQLLRWLDGYSFVLLITGNVLKNVWLNFYISFLFPTLPS